MSQYRAIQVLKIHSKNVRCLHQILAHRSYSDRKAISVTIDKSNNNLIKKFFKRINIFDYSSTKLKISGYILYESIVDSIPYVTFFRKYNLPDTFYSWFVVTELHVWMLAVRVMAEEEHGRTTRNAMVEALWADVQARVKKLGDANPSGMRQQVCQLSEEFQAALIGYDEGLLSSDDRVLAGAVWRRFFQRECVDAMALENLVIYIRQQMRTLDDLNTEQILYKRDIKWLPIT